MDRLLLQYVSDMDAFVGENWDLFVDKMLRNQGFTEEEVDELNERLGEYLEDHLK